MSLQNLPIDEVLPGVTLGANVQDDSGRILLRAGSLLTESAIESLRRRNVETLPIDVQEVVDAEQQEARQLQAERQLEHAFRRAGDGVATQCLKQAALAFMLEKKP